MVTPSPFNDSVQPFSQGAGQTRPVISGNGLVFANRSKAALKRPWKSKSFHSGIRLSLGQPEATDWLP